MDEPDLSGIDPLRVPEARRRIAAIDAYLKLPDPTSADTQRFAETIGLSRVQFGRLARVWRDHCDARLLVIGRRGAANRKYNVDGVAIDISNAVISEAGVGTTLAAVAPEIERRCAEAGISPPARSTIYNYVRAARATAIQPAEGPPRIVVGRMWFHLPVAGLPADAMPTLLAAMMLPERIVVAHELSLDPANPPRIGALIEALAAERAAGAAPRPLLLDPDDRRIAAGALESAGLGRTRSHDRSVQSELSKALSGRLGPLAVIHRRGSARPGTKRVMSRQDEPIPAAQVRDTIQQAINAHNAATLVERPAFELGPLASDRSPHGVQVSQASTSFSRSPVRIPNPSISAARPGRCSSSRATIPSAISLASSANADASLGSASVEKCLTQHSSDPSPP